MANRLNLDLTGKRVVLVGPGPEKDRTVLCQGGFGCQSFTMGTKIYGVDARGETVSFRGDDVEKLAEEGS
jgi:hypothetical protein